MDLLFELLQVALGTREKMSKVPSEREWNTIYEEAKRQTVIGVLLGGIEQLPVEQLPPVLMKLQWIGIEQKIEVAYRKNVERSIELAKIVRSVGLENCVLKGVATSRYYPKPERRQFGDIDLWIISRVNFVCRGSVTSSSKEIGSSQVDSLVFVGKKRLVSSIEFRNGVMKWLRCRYKIGHDVWHNVGVDVFEDVPVEIHFHPGWLWNPFHNSRLQKFFDYESHKIEAVVGNSVLNVPRLEFDVVFSLVHSYRHLIAGGIGLRHVVDYYYILLQISYSRDFLHYTSTVFNQLGLDKFSSAMMWVLKEVCGMSEEKLLCKPNEKEGRFLLSEIKRGGNFGQFCTEAKERGLIVHLVKMLPHYPNEVLWVLPWKVWHKVWRMTHR